MHATTRAHALVSLYSAPDASILEKSKGALAVCKYKGTAELKVIPASDILSVVAMVPFPAGDENDFFLVEKLGLDIAHLGGHDEEVLLE